MITIKINKVDFINKLGIKPVIERTEVIKEIPIIKEVAIYETAEAIRDKLALLAGDERLKIDDIDKLQEELDKRTNPQRSGGGGLSSGSLKYFLKENITPTGTINGVNLTFTLPDVPFSGTLRVYADGVRQKLTSDFTLSGNTITFVVAPTSNILCDYRV